MVDSSDADKVTTGLSGTHPQFRTTAPVLDHGSSCAARAISTKLTAYILETNRTAAAVFTSGNVKAATKRGVDAALETVNLGTLDRSVAPGPMTTRTDSPPPATKKPRHETPLPAPPSGLKSSSVRKQIMDILDGDDGRVAEASSKLTQEAAVELNITRPQIGVLAAIARAKACGGSGSLEKFCVDFHHTLLGANIKVLYMVISSMVTYNMLKTYNLHFGDRFGLRYYPVDMIPFNRNVGGQKFTKYSYLPAGWYAVIFDMPFNDNGERKDMRDIYNDLEYAYKAGEFGHYSMDIRHFSLSAEEAAHAVDCLSNEAAQAAKNYKKSGGNVQLLTAGPMSLKST